MNIETKFNVGQELYFVHHNSIYKRPVSEITIEVNTPLSDQPSDPSPVISYSFELVDGIYWPESKYEVEVFASLEDMTKNSSIR